MNAPDDRTPTLPPEEERPTVTVSPSDADAGNAATLIKSDPSSVQNQLEGSPELLGFVLLTEVGRGGMGVVYRARDIALNRDVAVKILHVNYPPDGEAARRFIEESQITSQLQHPGIPPVHQVGALADGRPFLVMKLIKGRTLDKLLKERAALGTDRSRFIAVFEQMCQAVGYAHSHEVIHRDLKPSNVMVGAFGEVQVMDWGLSKSLRDQWTPVITPRAAETPRTAIGSLRDLDSATKTGSILGTPAFMPPEQAGGEVEKLDARSDVFSLGAVLCVILTGASPYVADTAEAVQLMAIRGQLSDAWTRLDSCDAESELVTLCKRCLSVERDERPKDANELAATLASFRNAAEERARQAEYDRVRAETESQEQRKRRKIQLALAVLVGLFLVTGGGFAWWQDRQASEQELKDKRAEADRELERERALAERLRIEGERKTERERLEADRKATEARLAGERDAEQRLKTEQARQGVQTGLLLATDLRKQYKFKASEAVITQAMQLAKGTPELLPKVEQAQRDLAFVVNLDDIRYRKWVWIAEESGKGDFNTRIAPTEYRKAFADRGLDLTSLTTDEAARRIAASDVKLELIAAVDDWALYEPDEAVGRRLLEIVRKADPSPWTDRLRDPALRNNKDAVSKLAADADAAGPTPAALSVLAKLMERCNLNPTQMLTVARANHPTDFELAFALGQWHVYSRDGRQIGPYEAARALRPESLTVWNNLGIALSVRGDLDGAIAAYHSIIRLDSKNVRAYSNLGVALATKGDIDAATSAYKAALLLNAKDAQSHHGLGALYLEQKKYREAIACAQEAIKADPELSNAHALLGFALQQIGDIYGARVALTEAARLDPAKWKSLLAKLPPIDIAPPPRPVNR